MRLNIKFQLKWEEILASIRLLLSSTFTTLHSIAIFSFLPSFFARSLTVGFFFYLVVLVYICARQFHKFLSNNSFLLSTRWFILFDSVLPQKCRMKREQVRGCERERESWVCKVKANGIIESKARLEAEWKKNKNKQLQGTRSGLHVATVNAWNPLLQMHLPRSSLF